MPKTKASQIPAGERTNRLGRPPKDAEPSARFAFRFRASTSRAIMDAADEHHLTVTAVVERCVRLQLGLDAPLASTMPTTQPADIGYQEPPIERLPFEE